jgi:hypothetical protein
LSNSCRKNAAEFVDLDRYLVAGFIAELFGLDLVAPGEHGFAPDQRFFRAAG